MIRVVNAQGFATLGNAAGVAFQMPHPLARELYRAIPATKEELREFLLNWGGESEAVDRLVDDDYDVEQLRGGLANLGLPLETFRDLLEEKKFFVAAYERAPVHLTLHPSELGVISTALGKEGLIKDTPLRPVRDEAARVYLAEQLGVTVDTDDAVPLGRFR